MLGFLKHASNLLCGGKRKKVYSKVVPTNYDEHHDNPSLDIYSPQKEVSNKVNNFEASESSISENLIQSYISSIRVRRNNNKHYLGLDDVQNPLKLIDYFFGQDTKREITRKVLFIEVIDSSIRGIRREINAEAVNAAVCNGVIALGQLKELVAKYINYDIMSDNILSSDNIISVVDLVLMYIEETIEAMLILQSKGEKDSFETKLWEKICIALGDTFISLQKMGSLLEFTLSEDMRPIWSQAVARYK